MKVALCFIISYDHSLNKEEIWRKWIEPNKDIINVYFYYKELNKIKSTWILNNLVDASYIRETSYYHVIPAYLSVMSYAFKRDSENQWFCILTESCCPIISPERFRNLFYTHYSYSIFNWRKIWWNVQLQKRANLDLLPENLRLANDPYFILKREDVRLCFQFTHTNSKLFKTICDGGLANESLFAIILSIYKKIHISSDSSCYYLKKYATHLTDWSRMTSPTSPYLFKDGSVKDKKFIEDGLKENQFAIFIRKIAPEFPDVILNDFIYNKTKEQRIRFHPFFWRKLFILCFYFIGGCSFISIGILTIFLFGSLVKKIPYLS